MVQYIYHLHIYIYNATFFCLKCNFGFGIQLSDVLALFFWYVSACAVLKLVIREKVAFLIEKGELVQQ